MDLGLACHVCSHVNALRATTCSQCSAGLGPAAAAPAAAPPAAPAVGAPVNAPAGEQAGVGSKTLFFGALQQDHVVPRLVVIKGEGGDGNTYHLQGSTTVVGRSAGEIQFGDDPFLSPEHARFTTQAGRLFVQDIGSTNGIFLRIKAPTQLVQGDHFLVGEQLLRVDTTPFSDGSADANGTYYYGSPRPDGKFRVIQCLAGGGDGRTATAKGSTLTIGRDNCRFSFPDDRFISGNHARVEAGTDGALVLTDTGSRNGTFVRLQAAHELTHGDYLFIGQQLLRVEIG